MRFKYKGYIFQFTGGDHGGRHIHVIRGTRKVGVYDRVAGPIHGLERIWNKDLKEGIESFIGKLNESGFFHRD